MSTRKCSTCKCELPENRKSVRCYVCQKISSDKCTAKLEEWRERLVEFNNCCAYCLKRNDNLTMDHFYTISKGGLHTIDNIVPACSSCNSRKSDALTFDWIYRIGVTK